MCAFYFNTTNPAFFFHKSLRRCVLAILWVIAAVPETKDRSLEEIEALLVKGYVAPRSAASAESVSLLRNDGNMPA